MTRAASNDDLPGKTLAATFMEGWHRGRDDKAG